MRRLWKHIEINIYMPMPSYRLLRIESPQCQLVSANNYYICIPVIATLRYVYNTGKNSIGSVVIVWMHQNRLVEYSWMDITHYQWQIKLTAIIHFGVSMRIKNDMTDERVFWNKVSTYILWCACYWQSFMKMLSLSWKYSSLPMSLMLYNSSTILTTIAQVFKIYSNRDGAS